MPRSKNKKGVAVAGAWQPLSLNFLRSRACAELSPHGAKLFLDVLGMLGPNAKGNGDISLAPSVMAVRGWSGRETLGAAIRELTDNGLLVMTRQGSRLDCSLFACALYPLDCDLGKLDVRPGSYLPTDYMGNEQHLADPPKKETPAVWRRARKSKTVAPPRDGIANKRTATGQSNAANRTKNTTSFRHGTNTPVFDG